MSERLTDLWSWTRRYVNLPFVLMTGVLVYVFFFNDNSIIDNYRYQKEIDRLQAEIAANYDTLRYYEALNERLRTDPETMERIVREQYHMQRPNEDIFLVE